MKYYIAMTVAAAALAVSVASPAVAGRAAENPEFMKRQKTCKKEASAQGLHFSKKKAYVKECMAKI